MKLYEVIRKLLPKDCFWTPVTIRVISDYNKFDEMNKWLNENNIKKEINSNTGIFNWHRAIEYKGYSPQMSYYKNWIEIQLATKYDIDYSFYNRDDAMLFKLTWG